MREPERESATAPIGCVHKGVKIAPHPLRRVALQVAPVVFIDKARRRNRRARRLGAKLGHFISGQRPIDGNEFVILVLAQFLDSFLLAAIAGTVGLPVDGRVFFLCQARLQARTGIVRVSAASTGIDEGIVRGGPRGALFYGARKVGMDRQRP